MPENPTLIRVEKINTIVIKNLWGHYDFKWKLNDDVNILAGVNGSGKTTIFRIIENIFNIPDFYLPGEYVRIDNIGEFKILFNDGKEIFGNSEAIGANYTEVYKISNIINTFDTPVKRINKLSRTNTPLDVELEELIDGNLHDFNFVKLHSKIQSKTIELYKTNKRQEAEQEERRLQDFFDIINSFFQKTNKRIQFTEDKNIIFQNGVSQIKTKQLSAGEKQLLIILFQVFLQEEKPSVLLLDEPEISMHLNWQFKLIETLRTINPNCQLIVATHSPSIFGEGWGDKVVDIDQLKTPV